MNYEEELKKITVNLCKINALYVELAKISNMTYSEMIVCYGLCRLEKPTQKLISKNWALPKQTVNKTVKDLEKLGYVEFSFGDNKKEKIINLNEEGKKVILPKMEKIFNFEIDLIKNMNEDEFLDYSHIVAKYADAFEQSIKKLENSGGGRKRR